MEKIIKIVNSVLEEEFEITAESLKPEALIYEDIGLDSLDAVDLVGRVVMELGVRIEEEDARQLRTLEDVYKIIEKLLKEKQA